MGSAGILDLERSITGGFRRLVGALGAARVAATVATDPTPIAAILGGGIETASSVGGGGVSTLRAKALKLRFFRTAGLDMLFVIDLAKRQMPPIVSTFVRLDTLSINRSLATSCTPEPVNLVISS